MDEPDPKPWRHSEISFGGSTGEITPGDRQRQEQLHATAVDLLRNSDMFFVVGRDKENHDEITIVQCTMGNAIEVINYIYTAVNMFGTGVNTFLSKVPEEWQRYYLSLMQGAPMMDPNDVSED